MVSSLLGLPVECVLNILTRLPVADVVATASCCSALRQLCKDDCFWADLAEAKWGSAVRELKTASEALQDTGPDASKKDQVLATQAGSWQQYCYKRMSARTISPSPLNLLQERYPDPWQHIICCVLCSRTSGSEAIRTAIAAFLEALPTPSAVLAAEDGLLKDLLHPLGLQASRMAAVKSVSHNFLATDWQTPAEFHGCGKFVADSWRIFCRGHRDSKNVADANLKAYLAWLMRQMHAGTDGTAKRAYSSAQAKQRRTSSRNRWQQQKQELKDVSGAGKPQRQQQQQQQEGQGADKAAAACAHNQTCTTKKAGAAARVATRGQAAETTAGVTERRLTRSHSASKCTAQSRGRTASACHKHHRPTRQRQQQGQPSQSAAC